MLSHSCVFWLRKNDGCLLTFFGWLGRSRWCSVRGRGGIVLDGGGWSRRLETDYRAREDGLVLGSLFEGCYLGVERGHKRMERTKDAKFFGGSHSGGWTLRVGYLISRVRFSPEITVSIQIFHFQEHEYHRQLSPSPTEWYFPSTPLFLSIHLSLSSSVHIYPCF